MTTLNFYQIMDSLAEKIISQFTGPTDRFAESVFSNFIGSDKLNGSDLSDIFLVRCRNGKVFDSYPDYCREYDEKCGDSFIAYAQDVYQQMCAEKEKKNEG